MTSRHPMYLALLLGVVLACPCFAKESLDDILSCLETNGVLVDRAQAVRGGLEGILKSIDPGACLGGGHSADLARGGAAVTQAVSSVELWSEDIAYLKVEGLVGGCGSEVMNHLKALEGKAGIILDLRGAGGEDLDSIACLAGIERSTAEPLFVITDNQDKPISTNVVKAGVALRAPLMVLVDGRTRLAAEALAALWHGRPGIMLVGCTTAGDVRFREELTLPDGRLITLAMRKIHPLGVAEYEGNGLRPDVEVATVAESGNTMLTSTNAPARPLSAKSENDRELMRRVDNDAVLRRATDILLGLRTLSGYGQR